jgi:hypothetical protein
MEIDETINEILATINFNTYGTIRKRTLEYWLKETKRIRHEHTPFDDDRNYALDCNWQDNATELKYTHISLFCSLGEWASNITDLLDEEKYDNLNYHTGSDYVVLYRVYTRFFLVISELIEDFIAIYAETKNINNKKNAGESFEENYFQEGELQRLSDFINNICKHKYKKSDNKDMDKEMHKYDHHLPKAFEDISDDDITFPFTQIIGLNNLVFTEEPDTCILIPKLQYLIETIVKCYLKIDNLFKTDRASFILICDKYDQKITTDKTIPL